MEKKLLKMNIKSFTRYILWLGKLLNKNKKSKVIFYHDVHIEGNRFTDMSTQIKNFKAHVELIRKEGFEIVKTISQEFSEIQICFDDGFRGIYEFKEYFIQEKIYPTVFLAVELINQPAYLTKLEILELQNSGFKFQSHAYSHQKLTSFNNSDLKFELEESKKYLEELLSNPIDEICFPIGAFSERVLQACSNAGYEKMYSSIPGNYRDQDFKNVISRNLVQFYSTNEVRSVLYGGLTPFKNRYKKQHYKLND